MAARSVAGHPAGFLGLVAGAEYREPGTKRKRVNRNKKKAWKKHSSAQEVEEYLEDVRLQERRLGGLVADKPDESLYFMDTGSEEKKAASTDVKGIQGKGSKPLRIDLILQPDTKVPPPKDILSHQIPNAKRLKRKKQMREKLERRGVLPRKQRLLQAKLLKPPRMRKAPASSQPDRGFYDLWSKTSPLDSALADKDNWYLEQTKQWRVKRPDHLSAKPSELPAVEVISSGGSYNPTFESHQALLLRAHEAEVKKVKDEEKLKRQLNFPTADKAPTNESVFQELCQGLLEDSDEEGGSKADPGKAEEDEEEKGGSPVSRTAIREKKTEQQRKREKREKALVARRQAEKALRLKKQEVFQLRSIRSEMKQREAVLSKRKEKRVAKHKAEAMQPRRLGKLKYADPDTDVQLSEELAGSLRTLKPEGSILKDRFKSLQKRNLIEPRERAKFKRRHKVKYVEKRAFRDVTL